MTWHQDAACNGKPTDLFYPEVGDNATAAKAICAGCPVRETCLLDAIDRNDAHGIWGGLATKERRIVARELGRGPGRKIVAECGTHGGVQRHKNRGEALCGACRTFVTTYNRDRRRKERGTVVNPTLSGPAVDAWMHRVLDDIFGPVTIVKAVA